MDGKSVLSHRKWIGLEFTGLFIFLPWLLYQMGIEATRWVIPALGVIAFYFYWVGRCLGYTFQPPEKNGIHLRRVLRRFLIGGVFLTALTYVWRPCHFFAFPYERPKLWLIVMILYPLLSVVPQELIFRKYFFKRYAFMGGGRLRYLRLVNAGLFSYAHLVFGNWPALILTLIGGWLFAETYQKSRNIWLVSLEHILWGNLIFTIGLGDFFVGGTVRQLIEL